MEDFFSCPIRMNTSLWWALFALHSFFLTFSTHVALSLLHSDCEEATIRPYDSVKLWEWSVKAPKGQPFSGKGEFFCCFFHCWSCSKVPCVCASRQIRHSSSLRAAVCEWSDKLASETLHVSRHRSTAGFHPPCYPSVCRRPKESCLPFSPSCSPVGEVAEKFWLHLCIWCTVKSLCYCNHTCIMLCNLLCMDLLLLFQFNCKSLDS